MQEDNPLHVAQYLLAESCTIEVSNCETVIDYEARTIFALEPLDELTMKRTLVRTCFIAAFIAVSSLASGVNLFARTVGDADFYSTDWRATGPPGGDVRDLVVDPANPDRYYFGTLDGQIYTSADGGKRWQLLYNFGKPQLFVDNIIVDSRNSRVLYVGAHRHNTPGGFFKSTDGGLTWRESSQLKNEAIHSLAQSESDPNTLIAGTFETIFRSDDAGESWRQLPTRNVEGLFHVKSLAIDPRTANTIYAGTFHLPYKSTDGGQTWSSINNGLLDDSDIMAISIDPLDPNHIIASACSGIYESKTAGKSWRKVQGIPSQSRRTRAILQHPSMPGVVFAGTTEGFWRSDRGGDPDSWMVTTSRRLEINSIALHPSRPDMIFISTNNYGVMVSNDCGKSFVPTNGGFSSRLTNFILADRETPNRIYASTINTATGGGFLFVSNDKGETWRPSMRSMPPRLITYAILQDTRDANVIYLGTNLGIYRSLDRGVSWGPVWAPTDPEAEKTKSAKSTSIRKGIKASARPVPLVDRETVLKVQEALLRGGYHLATPDGKFGAATLAGVKKFQADRHLPVSGKLDPLTLSALGVSSESGDSELVKLILADAVSALVHTVDPETQRPGFLAGTNSGLYRSFDPSKGWERLNFGSGIDLRTTAISTSLRQPNTIWVGTASSGVLITRDRGVTWQQVSGVPADVPINTIVQDPQRPEFVYVGSKEAFYRSRDGGATWNRRGGNLPFGDITSILVNPRNSDEIFAGNAYQKNEEGGGVYRSTNGGLTWSRIDPRQRRLPSQRIWALAFDAHDQSVLFVGSHSAGVYVVPRASEKLMSTSR
jgi:photosystem II stability/assembly factor-like uncharacterized protein